MSSSEEDDLVEEQHEEDEEEVEENEEEIEEKEVEKKEGEEEESDTESCKPVKKKKVKEKKPTAGVVYLSRIPPFMRPRKVRHLLSRYGEVGRVYLAPEAPQTQRRRRRLKKNKRRNYTEGWVEFLDKRVGKATAQALNNTQIGGKKRYYYHDDIWNMKYLPKFRWYHLTEKIAYEQAVEEQKHRLEMSQVRREMEKVLENFDKNQEVSAIIDRKRKRGDKLLQPIPRRFKQRKCVVPSHPFSDSQPSTSTAGGGSELSDSFLSKIFP